MVIQVKTVITLGGKRHRLGGSRREPSGALRMFFYTLTWVMGYTMPTNGKIHYGYTEIWAPYNLKIYNNTVSKQVFKEINGLFNWSPQQELSKRKIF